MKAVEYLKGIASKHGWEIAGIATLLFIVLINIFPAGYIIDSGDVVQFLDLKRHYLDKVFYDSWMLGRISMFFGVFYLLDLVGISDTGQLSWYLGVFLFGSYFSFRVFCWNVFPRMPKPVTVLMSLFYAANIYTLYVFTSTWGFTSYQILYAFIPALTGLYIKALYPSPSKTQELPLESGAGRSVSRIESPSNKKKYVLWFLFAAFLASMSFSNPAFAVSSAVYFSLLTGALFVSGLVKSNKAVWWKIAIMAAGVVLLNMYWILPLIPQAKSGVEALSSSDVIVLPETLRKTSNAIFDSIRLMQTSEQEVYYPENFPYPALDWMKSIISVLAFVPFFIVLLGLLQRRGEKERRLYFVFFGLFVVFIMLVARVRFPFDLTNDFLFQLPGMNALRGWDKLAIFTPFIMSALLLMVLSGIDTKRLRIFALAAFSVLAIMLALPFYFGGIQTKMSHMLAREGSKDFKQANYSALVKIPEPYRDIEKVFAEDKEDNKISMLPYSPGSSIGKVGLPVWKVNGPSVAHVLYSKSYVELSAPYISNWVFAEDFEDTTHDPRWITDLFGLIGVKYVIFHKDAKLDRMEDMEASRKYLEKSGMLELITENDSFRLYKIKEGCVFPYVYGNSGRLSFAEKSLGLSEKIGEFRSTMKELSYERAGVKDIIVDAGGLERGQSVFLNEQYDPLWRAEYESPSGERVMLARDAQVKYANAWKIDDAADSAKIEIYYMPLRLLFIGMWISGAALMTTIGGLLYVSRKKI